jgi:hypothetical protein
MANSLGTSATAPGSAVVTTSKPNSTPLSFPDNAGSLCRVRLEGSHRKNLVMLLVRFQPGRATAPAAVTLSY